MIQISIQYVKKGTFRKKWSLLSQMIERTGVIPSALSFVYHNRYTEFLFVFFVFKIQFAVVLVYGFFYANDTKTVLILIFLHGDKTSVFYLRSNITAIFYFDQEQLISEL